MALLTRSEATRQLKILHLSCLCSTLAMGKHQAAGWALQTVKTYTASNAGMER